MNRVRPSDHLDLDSGLDSLPALGHASVGLGTHDTTSPVTGSILVVGLEVAVVDSGDELGELGLVLGADLGKGEDGSGLLVNDGTETGLALDDNVGDTHLAAEGGEEDNELDGVDVVGDQDERGLLVLDEADNVVETELGGVGLLGDILLLLALGDGGSLLGQALLLLDLGLRAVLVEELERLGGDCNALAMMRLDIPCMCVLTVAVSNVLELGNRRGDLQTEVEDLLLALKTDVGGPPDHAAKVALGLDVLADAIVLGALLDERVLFSVRACEIDCRVRFQRTLAAFLGPAFPWGKGAGAVFFPLGGILYCRGSVIENRNYQRMFIH